jgi:hypothetical protein
LRHVKCTLLRQRTDRAAAERAATEAYDQAVILYFDPEAVAARSSAFSTSSWR